MFTAQTTSEDKPEALPSTAAVVLAAGASRRMGSPKALLPVDGEIPLITAWLERLRPLCQPRVVVLGAVVGPIARLLQADERVVLNPRWAETGPFDSLRLALDALGEPGRVLVTPVDVPPPTPAELRRLLACAPPAALGWAGAAGHPVLLGPEAIGRALHGPRPAGGLAELIAGAAIVGADSPAALMNLNTPEDLARWRAYSSGR